MNDDYRDGYDEGYGDGLDAANGRIPLFVTLAVVFVLFGLGWLVGHFGPP